ncbi:MAG: hypothetical protein SWJ54_09015 [Cyanobacteriota bacterium]|nr:hypothetical protein [Cyanobacteriota bacterium]
MSRWTWFECILWVSAIAAIASISRPQPNLNYTQLSAYASRYPAKTSLYSPKCHQTSQKLVGLNLSFLPKSASKLTCK